MAIQYLTKAEWEAKDAKIVLTNSQVSRLCEIVNGLQLEPPGTSADFPFTIKASLYVMQGENGLELRHVVSRGFKAEEVFTALDGGK